MPDKKITELSAIVTIANNDVLPIVDISENITKKIDIAQLKAQSPVQSVNAKVGVVTLNKGDVGLSEVDNTSDANKPISTATQTALDAKQDTLVSGTNIKTINSSSILGSGNISVAPATGINATAISTGVVSNIEFNYLDGVTSGIQSQLDNKVDENAAILAATKTKISYDAKGLVTSGADATTVDIADTTNKRYVTDANLTTIANTSGTNSGDNAVNSLYSGLAASKQDALTLTTTGTSGAATLIGATLNIPQYSGGGGGTTWGSITGTLSSQTDLQTALDGKVDENAAITGATKTKITYDAKGLVTAGADATTADIADSTNKRYVTDANLTVIGNTSGTNSGDNAVNSLYSGLAASKQDTLVSGTNIKTVNSTSLVGSGDVAVQETLVSGTNIKTINSTSILGSGNLVVAAGASGVSGAIQFSDGSALASDATNFFWDNTNDRLGIGTNTPADKLTILGNTTSSITAALRNTNANGDTRITLKNDTTGAVGVQVTGSTYFGAPSAYFFTQGGLAAMGFSTDGDLAAGGSGIITFATGGYNASQERMRILANGNIGINLTTATARLHVKGSGATSATTSLKIQNSSSSDLLTITDDGISAFGNKIHVLQSSVAVTSMVTAISTGSFIGGKLGGGQEVGVLVGGESNGFGYLQGRYVNTAEQIRMQLFGNGVSIGSSSGTGWLSVGSLNQVATSRFGVPIEPTASANYGLVSLGSGAFNGSTAGFFTGAASGTAIAVNLASGATSDLLNLQVAGVGKFKVSSAGKPSYETTNTPSGTTGNQTINKPSGTVNIAAAGTTITVTNSLVSAASIVMAVVRTNDTTAYIKNVVPSAGSFVITLGAAATAEVSIGFIVNN